ncbi:hypothetical protein BESB_012000 [Besnoitia besnoiti]|uniref:Uncharacterized protein n=1 Tax=Besnoitia besnoiti TaxID=94643 RepID=A0A2A9M263_BESBE|nr:hypothetical protein BESB_012000 [Besnoitia besnoiti]PFH32588.1 hypothetical protein BESB_012000 [Besnoitia besnoiti]
MAAYVHMHIAISRVRDEVSSSSRGSRGVGALCPNSLNLTCWAVGAQMIVAKNADRPVEMSRILAGLGEAPRAQGSLMSLDSVAVAAAPG